MKAVSEKAIYSYRQIFGSNLEWKEENNLIKVALQTGLCKKKMLITSGQALKQLVLC